MSLRNSRRVRSGVFAALALLALLAVVLSAGCKPDAPPDVPRRLPPPPIPEASG